MAPRLPPLRLAVLVSGNGSNLQAIVDQARCGELPVEIVGVISDRPGVFALERARAAGIPAFVVDYAQAGTRDGFAQSLARSLDSLQPGLVAMAGFMRVLPAPLVESYRGRMLNVHPSLLPKYQGLHTYRRVLEAGDAWHGATVHFVTPELDAGPPVIQYRVRVQPGDTEESLRARVQRGEHLIYPEAIRAIATGRIGYHDGAVWRDGAAAPVPLVIEEESAQARGSVTPR